MLSKLTILKNAFILTVLAYGPYSVAFDNNILPPNDLSMDLPESIDGVPSRFLVSGVQPIFKADQLNFQNSGGTKFKGSALKFASVHESIVFGLPKHSGYFYAWDQRAASGYSFNKPICEGSLLDQQDNEISSEKLSHVILFNGKAKGEGASLFVLMKESSQY